MAQLTTVQYVHSCRNTIIKTESSVNVVLLITKVLAENKPST